MESEPDGVTQIEHGTKEEVVSKTAKSSDHSQAARGGCFFVTVVQPVVLAVVGGSVSAVFKLIPVARLAVPCIFPYFPHAHYQHSKVFKLINVPRVCREMYRLHGTPASHRLAGQ